VPGNAFVTEDVLKREQTQAATGCPAAVTDLPGCPVPSSRFTRASAAEYYSESYNK